MRAFRGAHAAVRMRPPPSGVLCSAVIRVAADTGFTTPRMRPPGYRKRVFVVQAAQHRPHKDECIRR
jgi:hypothetical protein